MTAAKRSLELDFLRFAAVLFVLMRHLAPLPADTPQMVRSLLEVGVRGGWMGVDLFFVLSGYLVSGLLFREYLQHGRIDVKQFLIRRGLKIYPAFYLLIFACVAVAVVQGWHLPWPRILAEVFFYQNYMTGLWGHTWSLAVEEHFYLTLPLVLLFLMRRRGAILANPFENLPKVLAGVALFALAARFLTWRAVAGRPLNEAALCYLELFPTHLRLDSLGFGTFLAYLHHFHAPALFDWVRRWRPALAGLFVIAILPPAIWELEQTPFLYTAGFTLIYLGMGALLLLCLGHGLPAHPLFRFGAYLGSFSYSVYLWHLAVKAVLRMGQHRWPSIPWWLQISGFFVGSFVTGIILGKCVEIPVLALRDRYFPSRSRPLDLHLVASVHLGTQATDGVEKSI